MLKKKNKQKTWLCLMEMVGLYRKEETRGREEEEEEAGEVRDHSRAEVDASDRQRNMITKGKSSPQRMTRLGRTNSLRLVPVFFLILVCS